MVSKKIKGDGAPVPYLYKDIIKKRDKNGKPIFYEKLKGGKLKRTSNENYFRVQVTKDYFKRTYKTKGKGVWQKKLKSARDTYKQFSKGVEVRKYNERDIYLKNKGYPKKNVFLNTAVIVECEVIIAILNGTIILINEDKRIVVDKTNIITLREMFSEALDWFYDFFKESIVSLDKNTTCFFQTPFAQVSGGDYPIIYEVYYDEIFVTLGHGEGIEKSNETAKVFMNTVRKNLTRLFKEYFG